MAAPPGTHWYHSHHGNQRSMGAYGPFVVLKVLLVVELLFETILWDTRLRGSWRKLAINMHIKYGQVGSTSIYMHLDGFGLS